MNTTTIIFPKSAIPANPQIEAADSLKSLPSEDICSAAAEKLGYQVASEKRASISKPLRRAIHVAGIGAFATEEVEAYKLAMVEQHTDRATEAKNIAYGKRFNFTIGTIISLSVLTGLVMFVLLASAPVQTSKIILPIEAWVMIAMIAVTGAVSIVGMIFGTFDERYHRTAEWHEFALEEYLGEVPGFALERALELKSRVPGASFTVVQLLVGTRPEIQAQRWNLDKAMKEDPLLRVEAHDELFYIDAWNEPSFKAKRLGV